MKCLKCGHNLKNEKYVYDGLKFILNKIKDKEILWHLDGSANLLVNGIDVDKVGDIDITTNEDGIKKFRKCLKEERFFEFENQGDIKEGIKALYQGIEFEILVYKEKTRLANLNKISKVPYGGLAIPIIPLKIAKEFYEKIGKIEKVKLIENHLSKSP